MRRLTTALVLVPLLLAACGDDADDDTATTDTTAATTDETTGSTGEGDPFDPAADVWITAVIGGGNERLNPGGVTVEIAPADVGDLAQKAEQGDLVAALTTGAAETECAAAFDGPSYEITLHLTGGDEVVGTCGLGIPLVDTTVTADLLTVVDSALQAG